MEESLNALRELCKSFVYNLNPNDKVKERLRLCLSCKWFSFAAQKCTQCKACVRSNEFLTKKIFDINKKCPKGIW